MLIVLNKLDLIEEPKRASTIEKMTKRLHKTLENTKFRESQVVAVAAHASSNIDDSKMSQLINIDGLIEAIKNMTFLPERRSDSGPFLFSVDHCFSIKGQGTVLTGTVLNGSVKINDVRTLENYTSFWGNLKRLKLVY